LLGFDLKFVGKETSLDCEHTQPNCFEAIFNDTLPDQEAKRLSPGNKYFAAS